LAALLSGQSESAIYLRFAGVTPERLAPARPTARMPASPQVRPDAADDERIWRLPMRMRQIVRQAQQEIIEPTRKSFLGGEQGIKEVRAAMHAAIGAAKKDAAERAGELKTLMANALAHLNLTSSPLKEKAL
jgi:hypothetical protein